MTTKKTTRRQASGLTPRQARFVKEYLVDLNGTQAAIRAGYSSRTANEQAARLLANISVKAAVEAGAATQHAQLVKGGGNLDRGGGGKPDHPAAGRSS